MAWTRFDVFLSYSRKDAERVKPLLDGLRRLGYRVFFDVQSIDPGQPWKRRLERSIRASRTLILCWSEEARKSDYITFEYSRAEALHKPVFPWLLDKTPLPAMLELQGIGDPDGARVAKALRPYLGWTLGRRHRILAAVLVVLAIASGLGAWRGFHPPPPPPWQFQGEVFDRQTRLGIGGVEVDVEANGHEYIARTNGQGKYTLLLPQPQPQTISIEYKKEGYLGDKTINWLSDQQDKMDLEKLK
jgi:hypothetical protein